MIDIYLIIIDLKKLKYSLQTNLNIKTYNKNFSICLHQVLL